MRTYELGGGGGGGEGGNTHIAGYGMCHFLRVLSGLENNFLGLFCSLLQIFGSDCHGTLIIC